MFNRGVGSQVSPFCSSRLDPRDHHPGRVAGPFRLKSFMPSWNCVELTRLLAAWLAACMLLAQPLAIGSPCACSQDARRRADGARDRHGVVPVRCCARRSNAEGSGLTASTRACDCGLLPDGRGCGCSSGCRSCRHGRPRVPLKPARADTRRTGSKPVDSVPIQVDRVIEVASVPLDREAGPTGLVLSSFDRCIDLGRLIL